MAQMIAVFFIVALVVSWCFVQFRLDGGRAFTAPRLAFSATALSLFLSVAGLSGFTLSKAERLSNGGWTGSVIWTQVAAGVVAGVIALFFWRRTLGASDRR